jgi:hypothetical protein
MQPIEADFENTWPEALLQGLETDQDALAAFQLERARIDRAAHDDVMLRIHRPLNPHQAAWAREATRAGEVYQLGQHYRAFPTAHASLGMAREALGKTGG